MDKEIVSKTILNKYRLMTSSIRFDCFENRWLKRKTISALFCLGTCSVKSRSYVNFNVSESTILKNISYVTLPYKVTQEEAQVICSLTKKKIHQLFCCFLFLLIFHTIALSSSVIKKNFLNCFRKNCL